MWIVRVSGVNYYFNACEFKENTSGTGNSGTTRGGLRGTVFAALAGCTFAFNNCSFHDNYGGRNSDDISWIGMDNTNSTLILANTTIAGDNYRAPETGGARKNNWGVIKFQNTGHFYLLNSIICSLDTEGNCFWVNGDLMLDGEKKIKEGGPKLPVYSYDCKTSKEGDGTYQEFLNNEARYTRLVKPFPERAEKLFSESEKVANERYQHLLKLVELYK